MSGKFDKVDKAFEFFKSKSKAKSKITLKEISEFTGWGLSTVQTYSTKRWSGFLDKSGEKYSIDGKFDRFSLDTFRQHHSQKDSVNKYFYQLLVDKAVTACVSAIEIYNKPDFKYREETFSIVMINAWELLLKAKLLQDNGDRKDSIYFKSGGKIIKTKSGNPKMISISKAINILESSGAINKIVSDGVKLLVEIRDESVHFVHNDMGLAVKIQSIGTASLKNFMTLTMEWFGYDFRKFNFYLMPVSFYHLSDVESFSVDSECRKNLMSHLSDVEKEHENDNDSNFSVSLRLEMKLVKTTSDEAIQIRVTDDPDAPEIKISEEDSLKNYPYSYQDICNISKKRYNNFKQNKVFNQLMREIKSEGERFCKERRLDPKNPKSLYKIFYHSRIVEKFDEHYNKK